MAEADGVDVNTFLEMEPEYVAGYAEARKMKVWTVGPGVAPPPAHGHHYTISTERRRDSSSLHAIAAREAARLGRP
jgi:hypothetical protein